MRQIRRYAAAGLALASAVLATLPAQSLERVPYEAEAFATAEAANAKIVLGAWATWCATCQTQIGIIDALANDPRFSDIIVFHIDYDWQKPVMRLFRIGSRSQIVAINGTNELGRLVSETDPDIIEAFLVLVSQQ